MHSEIEEPKEIQILRKMYKNQTRRLKILIEKEIELEAKNKKTEDRIKQHRKIDIIISEAEDLKIRVINKLNDKKKINTKINEKEKEKDLACISMAERLYGYN